ncbi:hypothetical protein GYA54_00340 [Candidatus Kuenenbacteria bacterium]|nr:hypothetical protein [Candidatus Kuenenbacteria bacterium]
MTKNFKFLTVLLLAVVFLTGGCTQKEPAAPADSVGLNNNQPAEEMYLGQKTDPAAQKEKLCGAIDKADIVIELKFAEGVEKDTSYETGFYFSAIYSWMKLARDVCDYRVGFSFEEFKNKGAAEVGVRGYNDNKRRMLEGEPISVIFDENGQPNIKLPIQVMVKN